MSNILKIAILNDILETESLKLDAQNTEFEKEVDDIRKATKAFSNKAYNIIGDECADVFSELFEHIDNEIEKSIKDVI